MWVSNNFWVVPSPLATESLELVNACAFLAVPCAAHSVATALQYFYCEGFGKRRLWPLDVGIVHSVGLTVSIAHVVDVTTAVSCHYEDVVYRSKIECESFFFLHKVSCVLKCGTKKLCQWSCRYKKNHICVTAVTKSGSWEDGKFDDLCWYMITIKWHQNVLSVGWV